MSKTNDELMDERNKVKVRACNLKEVAVKVEESGIGLDANPIDFFLAVAEELGLEISKKKLKMYHRSRDILEERGDYNVE